LPNMPGHDGAVTPRWFAADAADRTCSLFTMSMCMQAIHDHWLGPA
jgi:hypothetical protein